MEKPQKPLIIFIVVTLCFIWGNSALPGSVSSVLSNGLKAVINAFFDISSGGGVSGGLLRKAAHFTEYAVLGAEIFYMLKSDIGQNIYKAILCGMSVAVIDETIQLFSIDRGSSIKDVWIDLCGFCFGMAILFLIFKIISKNQSQDS